MGKRRGAQGGEKQAKGNKPAPRIKELDVEERQEPFQAVVCAVVFWMGNWFDMVYEDAYFVCRV